MLRVVLLIFVLGCDASPDLREAERLKETAFGRLWVKDYAGAIQSLKAAHEQAPHPNFLLNIAIAYGDWGGHCSELKEAIAAYRSACSTSTCTASTAEERLSALEKGCRRETKPAEAEPMPKKSTAPSRAKQQRLVVEIKVAGALKKEAAEKGLKKKRALIRRCMRASGKRSLTIHLFVSRNGEVRRITTQPSEPAFLSCFGTNIAFDPLSGGAFGTLTVAARLEP